MGRIFTENGPDTIILDTEWETFQESLSSESVGAKLNLASAQELPSIRASTSYEAASSRQEFVTW